jgi:1,2-diacylglycerol 3-beta-galactosyltransferase
MRDQKRILILTADIGFGHRSAANAIAAALNSIYGDACRVEVQNLLDRENAPSFLRDQQSSYDTLVRDMPEVYRVRYQISDTTVPNAIVENILKVALYNVVREAVLNFQPDAIVTTHSMYPAPVNAVLSTLKSDIPFLVVVTDLVNVHRLWFNPDSDLILVPTEEAFQQGLQLGLNQEQLIVTGIPVDPAISNQACSAQEARARLGWRQDLPTLLVAGSKRIKNLMDYLHVINHSGLPVQLILVAGGDDELFRLFQENQWHSSVHLYHYVDNMAQMLKASDCVVGKAGGLIITEALAAGLPLLFVDATPGQETGNAEFVEKNGAGKLAESPTHALETLFHWLDHDGEILAAYKSRAKELGQPNAAFSIAGLAWSAAHGEPVFTQRSRSNLLPALLELLAGFEIESGRESFHK